MIELPEQVTVTMYKDKRGRLHQTRAEAMRSDDYFARLELIEQIEALISKDKHLGQTVCFRNDPLEVSEYLLDFWANNWTKVLPLMQAYVRLKKPV